MSLAIHGLGTAVPPEHITPEQGLGVARFMAGPDVRTSTWLGPVYANSGNARRHLVIAGGVVQDILNGTRLTDSPFIPTRENDGVGPTTGERLKVYTEFAGPLALRAAAAALSEAKYRPDDITHLVTVSCTGFLAPGIDMALIGGLKLKPTVQRTHVGFMGCHGALNGLRVANAFATADPAARVLVAAVELCSLHYYYGNAADKLVSNAIFADGAAAVAGQAGAVPSPLELVASGSCVIPESNEDMAWTVGDHGFEMTLSRRVPGLIAKNLRPWLEGWLCDNGLSPADVKGWAVHPGGPKIVSAVEESLGLTAADLAASRGVFAEHGNMSSPTVLFVLDRLRRQGATGPIVALGFGPGLVAEAALFA
ncbi:chalcone synthase : Chalcone synthase OS=Synechococcus sp. KORDI-100 GN=KR100_07850 PE=4 SV=1: Chal_sti_synt_N: Chal_sti_synt_C [Gemmataceae bacterium]|nr:chalcone synthase : Chalcone synthase OS=Synechococcus sp. KORDI-100 GN=KR100_07850 PE=4 SV=1: Chal_sti_synt_N: Chal_sti_synt_C [Gemmataceae bacterium]VTT97150.1 chalcone synthase : Chalcone synthase OS=Synechococcus sp. KORDI-100 GN=KR100_07850 PE=4 SV=1: Chal_sti_synt_N: Chal_sti_synt_C [Gemmataceae bacterium]